MNILNKIPRKIGRTLCGLALVVGTAGCRSFDSGLRNTIETGYRPFIKAGLVDEAVVNNRLELYDKTIAGEDSNMGYGFLTGLPWFLIGGFTAIGHDAGYK